ncbi:MAG: aminopeptidase, partial [Candidatus Woesearchaeota archaeon]
MTNYKPSKEILEKYASVMINYACAGGKGIKKGDVVLLQVPECAKDFLVELRNAVLKSGGNPIIQYLPDDMSKAYFDLASDEQLSFFPDKYLKGIIDQIDHRVYVIADTDKYELKDVDPKKIMMRQKSFEQYRKWMDAKENEGKYSW